MAMDGNKLGLEITDAIMNMNAPPEVQVKVIELWQKIGCVIVDHIKTNAVVPAGIAVSTSGGGGATTAPGQVT
jgi:hypothetical protein